VHPSNTRTFPAGQFKVSTLDKDTVAARERRPFIKGIVEATRAIQPGDHTLDAIFAKAKSNLDAGDTKGHEILDGIMDDFGEEHRLWLVKLCTRKDSNGHYLLPDLLSCYDTQVLAVSCCAASC
jgi:hypothetical protein